MAKKKRTRRKKPQPSILCLYDTEGRVRIMLNASGDVPIFQMMDANERPRICMQVSKEGRAYLNLMAANGQGLVNISANDQGGVGFSVWGPNGPMILEVGWSADEGLKLYVWER